MNNPDVYDISYISQIRKVVLLLQIIPKNRNVKMRSVIFKKNIIQSEIELNGN